MRLIIKAMCLGVATELGGMIFAVLTGSYHTPWFTSPLGETVFAIPGMLLHIPGHQLFFLLFNFLYKFDDYYLSWRAQLLWLFTFQAAFWSVVWFIILRWRLRRQQLGK